MTDTSAARAAILGAFTRQREIQAALLTAMTELAAAAGLQADQPGATDDPACVTHALAALSRGLNACGELEIAIAAAFNEAGKLLPGRKITITPRAGNGVGEGG